MRVRFGPKFFPDYPYVKLTAIDPGGTTGVAIATLIQDRKLPDGKIIWDVGITTLTVGPWGTKVAAADLTDIALNGSTLVIVEDWRLRANMADILVGQDLPGPEAKGFTVGYCLACGIPIVVQQPADIFNMREYTQSKVEQWPTVDHEQDALCHLMVYLMRQKESKRK